MWVRDMKVEADEYKRPYEISFIWTTKKDEDISDFDHRSINIKLNLWVRFDTKVSNVYKLGFFC